MLNNCLYGCSSWERLGKCLCLGLVLSGLGAGSSAGDGQKQESGSGPCRYGIHILSGTEVRSGLHDETLTYNNNNNNNNFIQWLLKIQRKATKVNSKLFCFILCWYLVFS